MAEDIAGLVGVTGEDRSEFARRHLQRGRFFNEAGHKAIADGKYDDDPDMQAIARRRLSALTQPAQREEAEDYVGTMLGLVAYVTGLPNNLRWSPEFTRYVDGRFDEIAAMLAARPTPPTGSRPDGQGERPDIVLVSQSRSKPDGYQLHGLFYSFTDAVRHVAKDQALTEEQTNALAEAWSRPGDRHESAEVGYWWVAARQPISPSTDTSPIPAECRFCGATPAVQPFGVVYDTARKQGPREMFRVECQCGARSKCRPDEAAAIIAWNEPWQARPLAFNDAVSPTPADDREAVERQTWFLRHADTTNPDAFANADPVYFASECASAILAGRLSALPRSDAEDRVKLEALAQAAELARRLGRAAGEITETDERGWPTTPAGAARHQSFAIADAIDGLSQSEKG